MAEVVLADLDFSGWWKRLGEFKSIGITAPAGADGDSVGTQSALRELILQSYPGTTVRIINEEPCPIRYQFLPQAQFFEVSSDIQKQSPDTWPELMICVDGSFPRIGPVTTQIWNKARGHAQVDHHKIGSEAQAYQFRLYNPEAASTTEILYYLIQALSLKLTAEIAQAIYVGLIFDTGLFKHSNTKPSTLIVASELLKTGFDHTVTAEKGMLIRSAGALAMLKHVMNQMCFELQGRYVWSVLDHKSFQSAGGDADDREGLIDVLFLTRSCEIAGFYFEKSPGEWKMSFRSRPPHNVADLARSLHAQGGGHIRAAGCALKGPASEVLDRCHVAVKNVLG